MNLPIEIVQDYLSQRDWRVKENANVDFSAPNLFLHCSSGILSRYALNTMYKGEIQECHEKGLFHIHDLGGAFMAYCGGWDLLELLQKGLDAGINTRTKAFSAKHLRSAVHQITNFIGIMSGEFMGAQALSDVDILLGGIAYLDYMDFQKRFGLDAETAKTMVKREINQSVQELVYGLNYPNRWGGQPPFSNITLSLGTHDPYLTMPIVNGDGKITYKDTEEFTFIVAESLMKVKLEGDAEGKPFTFPIITINVTEDFRNLPESLLDTIGELTAEKGDLYFQNCVNGESGCKKIKPEDSRAMCCRLLLDKKKMLKHTGGLFGSGAKTGSIGVVTLNLPMIAYLAKDHKQPLTAMLDHCDALIDLASKSLEIKRELMLEYKELFPFTNNYLGTDFRTHFSTIGYLGMHECLLNSGVAGGIISDTGVELAKKILKHFVKRGEELTDRTGNLYNIEAVPAEGASYRLARKLLDSFPDAITSGTGESPYLTNSCHPPVELQSNILYLTYHQDELQRLHTGGTVVHYYLGEIPDKNTVLKTIEKICRTRIPYFTFTTVFSVCPVHGLLPGIHKFCPICGGRKEECSEQEGNE